MLTVGEVLENAISNLGNAVIPLQKELGRQQLENYEIAKKLGALDDDDWDMWEKKVQEYKENR
jgi:hypothetical protein